MYCDESVERFTLHTLTILPYGSFAAATGPCRVRWQSRVRRVHDGVVRWFNVKYITLSAKNDLLLLLWFSSRHPLREGAPRRLCSSLSHDIPTVRDRYIVLKYCVCVYVTRVVRSGNAQTTAMCRYYIILNMILHRPFAPLRRRDARVIRGGRRPDGRAFRAMTPPPRTAAEF